MDTTTERRSGATGLVWGLAAAAAGVWALGQARRLARRIDYEGKVVLVTGGSRGLGLELARQFLDEGARVAVCARDAETLERARAELVVRAGDAARVLAVPCDVTDASQVCDMVSLVRERLGAVDVLVNNAGIIQVGPTEHMTLADYEEAMRINFYGPLHLALALAPAMRARGAGRIVNVSSIGGKFAVPHLGPYSASKFALVGLSEGLRVSLAKDGVHVTTVCPGEMRTGSPRHAIFKGDHEAEYAWFTTSDTAPVMSMDTVRAARRILDAARHGDAELVMPLPAWLQVRFHGLFPGLSADLNALFERGLPGPVAEGEGTTRQHGRDVESDRVPAWAQKIQDRMAGRFNQGR